MEYEHAYSLHKRRGLRVRWREITSTKVITRRILEGVGKGVGERKSTN